MSVESLRLALSMGRTARAGATDLTERRHLGMHSGPVVDLTGLDEVEVGEDGTLRLGAMVRIARVASDPVLTAGWPGLAMTAGGLATPQIRRRATVGGNLLQDARCWYFRNRRWTCLKQGGEACLARGGDDAQHSCLDLGPCIAPHPSTLALALLALDATVEVDDTPWTMATLLGPGTNPAVTHDLPRDALLTAVLVPPTPEGAVSAYRRTIQRSRAEWPLVEAFGQVVLEDGVITEARLAIGGVANRPLRLAETEEALLGHRLDDPLDSVWNQAIAGFTVRDEQKATLIAPTLQDLQAQLLERS